MKMIKRTLILLIIATTIFTVVKCNRIEDADNIKQEMDNDVLPKDDEAEEEEKHKDNKPEEKYQEEIESPIELG